MKSLLYCLALSCSFIAVSPEVHAQQKASIGCIDGAIRQQAQEMKDHYLKQGFEVFRDAMISMSSQEPYPVIVQLQKGMFYQVIFVGNALDSKLKMELLDGHDNKLDEKTAERNREQPNYISYSFTPEQSDTYMFLLMQKLKNKDMCGSFTILQLKSDKKNATVTPYQGEPAK
ncbi:hypothetical protein [Taibaiella soli]|uniref:DUF4252 domain-containing protein n=1 Tax=Taibaiella soli TaxID=1649169 RepID=A0A2W2B255_9BACT|nr:hypothetical protein [Taibaiella soli]PZF74108.1 hypothetical protein DN068_03590 [Taibaiella soli]